ncbi:ATP-binding cassette domain-containing protein [Leeia sp.]|uniref:ATP-binding cassette domain-containing protein n=1 Tax=Leeia sp. TaxID=2884678 RepID=UPI0035B055E5
MTTLLSALDLHLDTVDGPLFSNLNFTLRLGDRIGLIGHNGCGKSTLLALLAGELSPDRGQLQRAHQCRLQRVEQYLPEHLAPRSCWAVLLDALPDPDAHWLAEQQLARLGLQDQRDVPAMDLSGGQHTRLLLGRALLQEPNLLLLDEPSNHLDLPAQLWLEQCLLDWKGALLLVSHDARLLDNVTRQSWILRDQQLYSFELPCSAARQALQTADDAARVRHAAEQDEIDRLNASSKRMAIWGRDFDNEKLSRRARVMAQRAEQLREEQTFVSRGAPWVLQLSGEALPGRQLLMLDQVAVRAAPALPVLFRSAEHYVRSGDRIALLGANGCGKSSLLRLLWQQLQQPTEDSTIRTHPAARVGYYDQSQQQLRDDASLSDALRPYCSLQDAERRQALIRAGFAYPRHGQQVDTLSGGERARLMFLALSLGSHHLLLLDEPSNHLDLEGKEALAEQLNQFSGALLLVSHDRALIEASCNRFWLIHQGQLVEWSSAEQAWLQLGQHKSASLGSSSAAASHASGEEEEALLQTLLTLEARLEADLARKPKQQKPQQQQAWRAEIARLQQLLGLV